MSPGGIMGDVGIGAPTPAATVREQIASGSIAGMQVESLEDTARAYIEQSAVLRVLPLRPHTENVVRDENGLVHPMRYVGMQIRMIADAHTHTLVQAARALVEFVERSVLRRQPISQHGMPGQPPTIGGALDAREWPSLLDEAREVAGLAEAREAVDGADWIVLAGSDAAITDGPPIRHPELRDDVLFVRPHAVALYELLPPLAMKLGRGPVDGPQFVHECQVPPLVDPADRWLVAWYLTLVVHNRDGVVRFKVQA